MEKQDIQLDFVKTKLDHSIVTFKKRVEDNRGQAFRLRMVLVSAAAVTTIFLGIKQYWQDLEPLLSVLALIVSAIVPVVAAYESFYEPRRMWVAYQETLMTLYGIADDLEFESRGGLISKEQVRQFYDRLEAALQAADNNWQRQRLASANTDASATSRN